jgi:4-hydroxyphenylpyruvate dioxygenase
MTTLDERAARDARTAPVLLDFDHLELWVGNARQAAAFFASTLGFDLVAYGGPETGIDDRASYVLEQGVVRFVVSGALTPESEIAAHVRRHGDGVHDVAFAVDDASRAFAAATARGADPVREPCTQRDHWGGVTRSTVGAYGDTTHTFVQRDGYSGPFAPGYEARRTSSHFGPPVGLTEIDHVVANVPEGALATWVHWYHRVFGLDELTHFDEEQISTEHSALRSTVVWNGGRVVLPVNEPAAGLRTSQIQEYLDFYRGPGVQHIAIRTDDIVRTVRALRDRGLCFLDVPPTYYDDARERIAGVPLPWDELSELGILVDRDAGGHLLQIFTEGIADRPTLFLEIIQRVGARGFGAGNFKALFEAIEREQSRRGNL